MLQLKCTGKVQKYLGLRPKDLAEPRPADSLLGHWYVNLFFVDRRKTFLFMSERTLLSFVLYGARKDHVDLLPDLFLRGAGQLFAAEGFGSGEIDQILSEYEDLEYTPTTSRKVLGNMTDLMFFYRESILHDGGFRGCDLWSIIAQANRTPQRNLGWSYSIDLTQEILRGLPG